MQTRGAGDQTTDLLIGSQPALPTELQLHTSLQKLNHSHFNMFFNENEYNYVKMIIPSNIPNQLHQSR